MIKDFWIYQRKVQDNIKIQFPWALYVVMEYEKGKRKASEVEFDVTLYCEELENETKSVSTVGIRGDNIAIIVGEVEAFMLDNGIGFTSDDHIHLQEAFLDMFTN